MKLFTDLHAHTTASDGQYTPTQLVQMAKEKGLQVLAITDHDTIAGVNEAQRAGGTLGLQVIRGVQLNVKEHHSFHILGYGLQDGDTELSRLCEQFRAGRDERKYKIADFFRDKGVDIDLSEVELASGEVIVRPHFAQVMVKYGYVSSNREAFDHYLDTEEFRQKVKCFRADAIECCYPKHTPEQQAMYLGIAKKYGLYVTGGSDFHGEKNKPDHPLAALELELDWLVG